MFLCGQEEPLQSNSQIHLLEETTGAIVLSDLDDQRLNRYSFLWFGNKVDSSAAFAQLMNSILTETGVGATWLAAYRTAGDYRTRGLLHAAKRAKEGWTVYRDEALAITSKYTSHIQSSEFRPVGELPYKGLQNDALVIFLGSEPQLHLLLQNPLYLSVEAFARFQKMIPGRQFLIWLADQHSTIAYQARSDLGKLALIVVGTMKIQTKPLVAQGIISEIREGTEAASVWHYVPRISDNYSE